MGISTWNQYSNSFCDESQEKLQFKISTTIILFLYQKSSRTDTISFMERLYKNMKKSVLTWLIEARNWAYFHRFLSTNDHWIHVRKILFRIFSVSRCRPQPLHCTVYDTKPIFSGYFRRQWWSMKCNTFNGILVKYGLNIDVLHRLGVDIKYNEVKLLCELCSISLHSCEPWHFNFLYA